jgi:charged multivesicular body protein 5
MDRLFGKSTKAVKDPSEELNASVKRLDSRASEFDKKIHDADRELCEIKSKMSNLKEGPVKNSLKTKALNILKRKKMLESHRNTILNQSMTIEQADMSLDTVRNTVNMYNTMTIANKEMKKQMKRFDVGKLEDVMYELKDYADEFNSTMENFNTDSIDESTLDEELAALDEADYYELKDSSYLDTEICPESAPSTTSVTSTVQGGDSVVTTQ